MPNLIGTAPNQVPVNGLLGTLAFQDSSSVTIGALNATTSATSGTATFASKVWFGASTPVNVSFANYLDISGATTAYGNHSQNLVRSTVTSAATVYVTAPSTEAAAFTLSSLTHYQALQGTIGAGSAITTQYGFFSAASLTGATNNYAFIAANTAPVTTGKTAYGYYSTINAATGGGTTWGLYMAGTADNYIAGNLGLGTASFGTSAAKVLGMANATAPSTSPAGMGQLYVEGGALKFRGSSGTITVIAPA